MDYPYNVASDKIIRHLLEAEVMSIFFPRIGKALIVDTRHNYENGPVVLLDGMVESPEERLRSIKRLRPAPSFPQTVYMLGSGHRVTP